MWWLPSLWWISHFCLLHQYVCFQLLSSEGVFHFTARPLKAPNLDLTCFRRPRSRHVFSQIYMREWLWDHHFYLFDCPKSPDQLLKMYTPEVWQFAPEKWCFFLRGHVKLRRGWCLSIWIALKRWKKRSHQPWLDRSFVELKKVFFRWRFDHNHLGGGFKYF